jgi:hypothetical protein
VVSVTDPYGSIRERLSKPELLLFLQNSSSIVLTRLSRARVEQGEQGKCEVCTEEYILKWYRVFSSL